MRCSLIPSGSISVSWPKKSENHPDRFFCLSFAPSDDIIIPIGVIMDKIKDTKSLGMLIRQERRQQGLTQEQLAGAIGVGVRFLRDRTRHFHFKVQRPGRRVRTTQLHFPGEPRNAWQSASVFLGRRIGSYGLRGLVHPGWDGVDVEEGRIPAGRRLQSGRCPQQISTASYRLA